MKLILQNRNTFSEEETNYIENLGYDIAYYEDKEVDGEVFVGMFRNQDNDLKNMKNLKYIQSVIAGFDSLNMEEIAMRNIIYCNASGIGSDPIAEYVVLKILDYYKQSSYYRKLQSEGVWGTRKESDEIIEELCDKRILVLGTGSIGLEVAKRLKAFNSEVIGINTSGKLVDNFDEVYLLSELSKVLPTVDVVVGALPLNEHTKNIYNKQFFTSMKDSSIFINVGRGPQLVLGDLEEALEKNLAHAYLDVLPVEPLAKNSPLWRNENISITPHNSSSSNIVINRVKKLVIENLDNYINNKDLVNRVI